MMALMVWPTCTGQVLPPGAVIQSGVVKSAASGLGGSPEAGRGSTAVASVRKAVGRDALVAWAAAMNLYRCQAPNEAGV